MAHFAGLLGILVLLLIAYLFSTNRRAIQLKTVLWGLGLQFFFAVLVFRLSLGEQTMGWLGQQVTHFLGYSFKGSEFVFGALGLPQGSPGSMGFFFAFQVLPTIIFISAFFALMYYLGLMQLIIRAFAVVMKWVMGISGAESLNVAASIFMGQTEAPLTIRPFLPECTRSELMTIMTAGMAHVSGGIMAAYILYGIKAEHLLSAVIMTAPGTILMSKMLVPEVESPKTAGRVQMPEDVNDGLRHPGLYFGYDQDTICDRLNERGIPWRIYHGDIPQSLVLTHQRTVENARRYEFMDVFFSDARG